MSDDRKWTLPLLAAALGMAAFIAPRAEALTNTLHRGRAWTVSPYRVLPADGFNVKLCTDPAGTSCHVHTRTDSAGYFQTSDSYYPFGTLLYLFVWSDSTYFGEESHPQWSTRTCTLPPSGSICQTLWTDSYTQPRPLPVAAQCPLNGAGDVADQGLWLKWTSALDQDRAGRIPLYDLYLAETGQPLTLYVSTPGTSVRLGNLQPGRSYTWQVNSRFRYPNYDSVSSSPLMRFVTGTSLSGVIPPPAVTVGQSTCSPGPGADLASMQAKGHYDYHVLQEFLSGGSASTCDTATRQTPRLNGQPITPTTFFPAGVSTVEFDFLDRYGNLLSGTQTVTVLRQGDLNLDGSVDASDVAILNDAIVGNVSPGTAPFLAPASSADVNGDGVLDIFDVLILQSYLRGNTTCLVP